MNPKTKSTVVAIIQVTVGLAIGLWVGIYVGNLTGGSTAAAIGINTQVHHLKSDVKALQELRNQDTAAAIETIESRLDQDIISMLPELYENLMITEETLAFIEEGLHVAKRYRAAYPRTSQGELIDKDIKRVFSMKLSSGY